MELTNYDLEYIHKVTGVEFEKIYDAFEANLVNKDLVFHFRLLKEVSYLFISLVKDKYYLVEKVEFFENEPKEGLLRYLKEIVLKYLNSDFQLIEKKSIINNKYGLKIMEDGEWLVLSEPVKGEKF